MSNGISVETSVAWHASSTTNAEYLGPIGIPEILPIYAIRIKHG